MTYKITVREKCDSIDFPWKLTYGDYVAYYQTLDAAARVGRTLDESVGEGFTIEHVIETWDYTV